jgi:thiol-disulfide isomerase/thioredoxin
MSKVKKPIFLVTYAAWCIPGKGEIPALNKLAKENKAIEFIVIVFGKKKEAGKFAKKFNSSIEICYAHKNYKNDNEIDKLEDFWISHEYKMPAFCSNGYDHYLGMNNICIC